MNEQETRKKIAQILATQLCPNKNAHFASWGFEANCYSRMNFVECEKMADATDALIEENIGDTSELFGKIEQLEAENERLKSEKTCKNMSDKNPVDEFVCSKCGFMTDGFHRLVIDKDDGEHIYYEYEIKYCPNCGAKVEDEK